MFIKDFQCGKCGEVQERWLDDSDSINEESCEKCGAEKEFLNPVLSTIEKHGSWGRWAI